ncbi:MAG: DNA gyrase subunit A [Ruminococcaceae bacterium]|nr:DNA gyrase subunit A [Oscillospiraceae bacterium]MBQ3531425.1 DNA gyrase subunit A [Oscillospiraceae bacterium]
MPKAKLITVDIEKEMKKSFLDYSMSVIVSRALPDVRDGLKPVHRRILYTMYENGLEPTKAYKKCAATVGDVLGKYHPHGDASVYDAMVRLAQDFSMRAPLVDGHGNFGSIDGDPPAAYRYTESRMSKMATKMLTDIDKDTVDFMGNYDDSRKEPVVLPSKYPNLLVNGSVGIAVGMATNIPPHNLRETVEACCCLIDNPEATLDDLMEHIKGPDFPTGGIIMGRAGIRAAYATGRAKLIVRSRAEIQEWKNDRYRIVVTEIPYMVNKARLIESIADLVKEKRVEGISDLRDESDREGLRIVIELKRDANAQVVLNQLYTYTQLQDTCGVIMLALVNGVPKILSLKEVLQNYIDFQREVIIRRTKFELKKLREREHILEGLKIAQDNIDEVIRIIRSGKDDAENRPRLMERFGLSEIQANAILQMRLGRLSSLNREAIENELAEIRAEIARLEEVLKDMHLVDEIIKSEMREIAEKSGDDRRTGIETISGEMDLEDLIPVEDRVITLTHFGYIKSQPVEAYKAQRRGGRGISGMTRRDEDYVESLFTVSTHDYILFFTDKGKVFRIKGYEIPESQRAARGTNIVNVLPLEQDEKVTTLIKLGGVIDEEGTYLTMVTKNGVIKRTRLSQYRNVRKSGLNAISLDEGDELKWVRLTGGEDELIVATRKGYAIHFKETDARELGRTARGVRAIELREGDEVVGMEIVEEGKKLLTISEGGKGRRSEFSDYSIQNRGGKGIQNYKTDNVAGIKAVADDDDIIAISSDGIIIRLSVDEVNVQFRSASGVKVMRLASEESRVVSFTVAPKGEDEEESEGETEETSAEESETTE